MKYGIITFHNTLNCGAGLQAYALCRFLRDNSVACDILDYQCPSIVDRELKFKKSNNPIKTVINYLFLWPKQKRMNQEFISILRSENMLSACKYNPDNIIEANQKYDGFITGSDQVWNLNITKRDYNFFLDFAEDSKFKISFAASIGEKWDQDFNHKIRNLISRYTYLSVREIGDCNFIKEEFCENVIHVCDPTMLLTANDWAEIAKKPCEEDYVLLYNPRSGADKLAKKYADENGKKLIWIGTGKLRLGNRGPKTVKPDEWIGYIMNASAVFTDSYHGLLFSLYFGKPVWTTYNGTRSSRQDSLYSKLEINECVYSDETSFEQVVDYKKCEEKICAFRNSSVQFLLESIKGK